MRAYRIRRATEPPLVSAAVLQKVPRRALPFGVRVQEKLPVVERLAPRSVNWRITLFPSIFPVTEIGDRAAAETGAPSSAHF